MYLMEFELTYSYSTPIVEEDCTFMIPSLVSVLKKMTGGNQSCSFSLSVMVFILVMFFRLLNSSLWSYQWISNISLCLAGNNITLTSMSAGNILFSTAISSIFSLHNTVILLDSLVVFAINFQMSH